MDAVRSFSREAGRAAGLLRAMSNEQRLLILCYLAEEGELAVGQLCDRLDLSQSALSQHLAKLRVEGLVATRKQAQTVYYRIDQPKVLTLLSVLHDLYCPALGAADAKVDQQ